MTLSAKALIAGTRITICPAVDSAATSIADVLKLLDCAPDLRLTLDIGYAVYLGLSRRDIAGLFQPRRIHPRPSGNQDSLADWDRSGSLDLHDLLIDLAELNYTNAVSVAYLTPAGEHGAARIDPIVETVNTRENLRNARAALRG